MCIVWVGAFRKLCHELTHLYFCMCIFNLLMLFMCCTFCLFYFYTIIHDHITYITKCKNTHHYSLLSV